MFTGIVQDVGTVLATESRGGDLRLTIGFDRLAGSDFKSGDSICVQGCCLTVTELTSRSFGADLSRETLTVTTLGELQPGAALNLEPSLRAGDPLGGHLVSGHVDGIGRVTSIAGDARSLRIGIAVPEELARYVARKGSIAVDGVSLTVNDVAGSNFGVNIIPHTQAATTLGRLSKGARVNIEVDQVARYIERMLQRNPGT